MKLRSYNTGMRCFAIAGCGCSGLALEIARNVAAVLAASGLDTLLVQQGDGSCVRGKARHELSAKWRMAEPKELRSYLAWRSPSFGMLALDEWVLSPDDVSLLGQAYALAIVAFDAGEGRWTPGVRALAGESNIPCLYAVRAKRPERTGTAGGVGRLLKHEEAGLQPAGFVISPYDLGCAARFSRQWKLPSWGDPTDVTSLAERLLSCTMSRRLF